MLPFDKDIKLKIGILGGSFNPAHKGHLYISEEAIRRMELDYVLWLLTPQNPLKEVDPSSSFEEKMESARKLTRSNKKIIISDLEKHLDTIYTYDALKYITLHYPNLEIIWLMGADNLEKFHLWKNWEDILSICPMAIFDREGYSDLVLYSKLTTMYNGEFVEDSLEKFLPGMWYFFKIKKMNISSTDIRNKRKLRKP